MVLVVVVAVVDGENTSSGQMMHSAGQGVGDAPERGGGGCSRD